jgi:acyl-CoA thioesterase
MEDHEIHRRIVEQSRKEPFARLLGMNVKSVERGYARVEMSFTSDLENLFGMAHGGAIYSLLDEAFQAAGNSHGSLAVALNVNVTYVEAPEPGSLLVAEAREVCGTQKTATYTITVSDSHDRILATCQALVYRKGKPLPFLEGASKNAKQ